MGGFAWVTLATNDSYSLGALVLAHSLKAVGTTHQLAVLVTPGVTSAMRDKLAAVFNLVQEVNILDSRDETNLRLLKRPELGITFTKLHCWRLTQYEKCVFLDADTLVLQYCDELFEREELSAAPDVGWPDCFNSGVFVFRPSLETYEKLIQFALEKGSFDGGDQGLLNLYFSDWAHKDISRHLPFIYNMCSTACYSYLPAFKQFGANAKIIHFIGAQKPWLQYFNTETRKVQPSGDSAHLQEVLQRWWDIFCSLIHPHLSPAMAGLAGAFAQLTMGVPRTVEQDTLENLLRKQAWEVGNIDYLGRDSFDNIWSKITETLSAAPPQPPTASQASAPEPSAPVKSQSESAPPQEEANPVPSPVTPVDTATDNVTSADNSKLGSNESSPSTEAPKDQLQLASTEISATATSKEGEDPSVVAEEKPPLVESSIVPEEAQKIESSQPSSSPEASAPSREKELVVESVVCPIPEKNDFKDTETKVSELQTDISKTETKASEPQTDAPITETKALEPEKDIPKAEAKAAKPEAELSEKPKEKEVASEILACPIPQKEKTETKVAEPQVSKEAETAAESVCPLPEKKEAPKEAEPQAQVTVPPTKQKESEVSSPSQQETPAKTPQVQEVTKISPQSQEAPRESPQAQEIPKPGKPTSATTKEPETSSQPPVQSAEVAQQPQASSEKPEVSAQSSESAKVPPASQPSATDSSPKPDTIRAPKETPKAPELTAASTGSSPALKVTSKVAVASKESPKTKVTEASPPATPASKESPKTKVTEATPPATPASPSVEKTKQTVVAEASIPDTPPPTEGGSTPTPPPRKTDKPKKVSKPKK